MSAEQIPGKYSRPAERVIVPETEGDQNRSNMILEVGAAINRVAVAKNVNHGTSYDNEMSALMDLVANRPGAADALADISKREKQNNTSNDK